MRHDKPRVKNHKQHGTDSHHQPLFERTQVKAIQVARHSSSVRLSSSTQCQVAAAPRGAHVTCSPSLGSNKGWPLTAALRMSESKSSSRLVCSAGALPLSVSFRPSLKLYPSRVTPSGSSSATVFQQSSAANVKSWRVFKTWNLALSCKALV